ncbi:MAG: PQQ-binding-like beta-propeller repeat protein [Acidobacteriota bacterium]
MALIAVGFLTIPDLAAAERVKSLFRSQPVHWQPFVEGDGRVRSVQFTEAWSFDGFDAPFVGDPIEVGGTLLFSTRDGRIAGLDPGSGQRRWEAHLRDALGVGPAAGDGIAFQATRGGRLVALDISDGRLLWSIELGSEPTATPRVLGDRLYVGTADESLVAIDPGDGTILHRLPLPGRPTSSVEASPGALLIGTDHGMLLSIDSETLTVNWRHYAMHAITSPPLYHDHRIYVATADHSFHCLRSKNGKRRWTVRTGALTTARPFVRDGILYILSYDNDIALLKAKSGHLLARVRLDHRLDADAARTADHLYVVPFTEASVVGLALPGLQGGGQFDLDVPGEWFTTAPLVVGDALAVGYGRAAGRVLMLSIEVEDDAEETDN